MQYKDNSVGISAWTRLGNEVSDWFPLIVLMRQDGVPVFRCPMCTCIVCSGRRSRLYLVRRCMQLLGSNEIS